MKKIIIVSSLVLHLFASDDYVPLSNLSDKQKEEYNFINKNSVLDIEKNNNYEKIENIQKEEEIQTFQEEIEEVKKEPIVTDKEFVKEYKKQNILKDEKKESTSSFSKDFSVTPKISYMHVTTNVEDENIEKTHEVVPEILFTYKNHNLKFDYLGSNVKKSDLSDINIQNFELETKWYRFAYLYSLYNADIGIAYNYLKLDGQYFNITDNQLYKAENQKFPTIEAHLKNSEDNFLVEYGGFYGKNDSDVKNAYEYYLTLGYRVFNNDNLIINAGYKNRTVDLEDDDNGKIEYKGPVIGISSTF